MRILRQEIREFSFFICVTGCYFVAQAGLKFMIILPLPPKEISVL